MSPKINCQWSNHNTVAYQNWVEIDAIKPSKNNTLYYLGGPGGKYGCEREGFAGQTSLPDIDYYDTNLGSGLDLEPFSAR